MNREFGSPSGDRPREEKENVIPVGFLSHPKEHRLSIREASEKKQAKRKETALPLKEIATQSVQMAHSLFTELSAATVKKSIAPKTRKNLIEIDVVKEDAQAVRLWGKRFEKNPAIRDLTAEAYFKAASLGSEAALEDLQRLLPEEQEEVRKFPGSPYQYRSAPMLSSVVEQCAEQGLSATTWITKYAIDPQHEAYLKLRYYTKAKETVGDGQSIGERYRDEVTQQFLLGEGLHNTFAWDHSAELYAGQENDGKKRQVFERFKEIGDDIPLYRVGWDRFFNFAQVVLKDRDVMDPYDTVWIEETADHLKQLFSDEELKIFNAPRYFGDLQVSLTYYSVRTPHAVISKINEVAHEQLDMELDDFEKKNIFMARDATLSQYAKDYAAAREFSLAKPFLLEISNDIVKKRIVKECLTEVKTKEELAVFTPDTMTLAFDSELKEMFITKEVLLGDDSTAISTMAKSFASGINAVSLSIQKDFLKECVLATYLKDTATGSALASEVLTILKERELQSELVKEIAEIQVGHNDPAGWGILFEHASSVTSPVTQLGEFAHLAVLSAKAMKKETSSFK